MELSFAQLASGRCLVGVLAQELLYLIDFHLSLVCVAEHVLGIGHRHQCRVRFNAEALTELISVAHLTKTQPVQVPLREGFHNCGRLFFVSEIQDLVLVIAVDELIIVGQCDDLHEILHFSRGSICDLVPVHGPDVLLTVVFEIFRENQNLRRVVHSELFAQLLLKVAVERGNFHDTVHLLGHLLVLICELLALGQLRVEKVDNPYLFSTVESSDRPQVYLVNVSVRKEIRYVLLLLLLMEEELVTALVEKVIVAPCSPGMILTHALLVVPDALLALLVVDTSLF